MGWKTWLKTEAERAAGNGRRRDLYNITKTITNKGRWKMAAVMSKDGEGETRTQGWKDGNNISMKC